ncbi:hypothetical protein WOLCODRAFT_116483 [Wolfiporia cocos MD-104 SS10]|uniref:60S ribosomal protein L20 n=1 Tax=Wolfiporia cocos (strain MD-104) TaxID=742152 RepID=A0A2H3JQI1_WOLCO|nr:hypothetical protein WOLCODRAFT_116483 [Wolfiporia cocos MD-104 SS10]
MKYRLPTGLNSVNKNASRLPERSRVHAPDPLVNHPTAVYQNLEEDLTFIHRPPPTVPAPESLTTSPASPLLSGPPMPAGGPVPPPIRKDREQRPLVSDEDILEIRRLRLADPFTWSRTRLAEKFNCTPGFIGRVAAAKPSARKQILAKRDEEHETVRSQWGENKTFVREARRKRKELW